MAVLSLVSQTVALGSMLIRSKSRRQRVTLAAVAIQVRSPGDRCQGEPSRNAGSES